MDAYGCHLMGLELSDVPYIQLAERWGGGSTKVEPGDVIDLNEPDQAGKYPAPSGRVGKLARRVEADQACSACYAALVRAIYVTGETAIPIAIGQGWKGRPYEGLGIGRCCDCAAQQVKGCPPTTEDIVRALRG